MSNVLGSWSCDPKQKELGRWKIIILNGEIAKLINHYTIQWAHAMSRLTSWSVLGGKSSRSV